jgi:Glycosyltransferase WbsX
LDGFVYHHNWFYDADHPGPNLHAPLEALLLDGEPNVPFALHWCASKWTSTWNGMIRSNFHFPEPGVLQKQFFPTDRDDPAIAIHY